MAQYDGSIRINTQIKTKEAQVQLSTLENRIVKTSDKIASLRSKMDSLKNVKIPTQEYSEITAQIQRAELEFNKLLDKQEQMQREGKNNGAAWDRLSEKIDEVGNTIRYANGELKDLVDTGKAFTLGSDTDNFSKLGQQLRYAEDDLSILAEKHDLLQLKQEKVSTGYKNMGDAAKKSFTAIGNMLKKANSTVNSFGRKIKEIAQRHLPHLRKEADRSGSSFSKFNSRLKSLLSGIFIFNVISAGFRKMFSGIGEGFKNFYSESSAFGNSIENIRNSLSYLQNSFAAAFAPIVEVAIPYIQKLINYMAGAVNAIAQLIAALFGKKTYTKAVGTASKAMDSIGSSASKSNNAIGNTSSALNSVANSAREAQDALEGYLSPLDEINKYKTDKENSSFLGNISGGGVQNPSTGSQPGNAAGDQFGEYIENMFEEIPIDSIFEKMADKIKDVFSKLFAPLKEAWNREGKFVMDSWKSALKEVWNLVKSVGSDFLEVWQQEKTIKIFEDILHIIGDIGQVVKHLAHNFRVAWEENETGKRILEGVRDIIGVIVANIRHAADATVSWAKNINFAPLLTKIQQWVASMVPVMDNLSGIITDFYEHVLLPLGKWVLEKGLPDLLQVFIDFNNKVDWEALRARIAEFWKHLEPFAEKVGEGLIIFIGRLADALANFINSPVFENFLTMIENWMDNAQPEKIADYLEFIAKAILFLKTVLIGFKGIENLASMIKVFKEIGSVVPGASGALKSIGAAIAGWAPHIAVGGAIVAVIKQIKKEVAERVDTKGFGFADWISATLELSLQSWKQKFEGFRVSMEIWWSETWMSDKIWKFGQWWSQKVSPWFTREKWSGLWNNVSSSLNGFSAKFQSQWSRVWDSAQSKVSSAIQSIKNGLQSALEWIQEKIKGIKDAIDDVFGSSKKSVGGFGKGSSFLPFSAPRVAVHPAIAALSDIPIPGYATGQVIPTSMKRHLAILGDNTRETEVVSPLSTIRQALREEAMSLGLAGAGGNGNLTLKVYLQDEQLLNSKKIFEAVIKQGKIEQMSSGKNRLLLEN